MSANADPITRLQGAFLAPLGATIRWTHDPTGVPVTSDLVVAQGDFHRSLDAFLAIWQANLISDIGPGFALTAIRDVGGAYVYVETPGSLNYSIVWSFAGDGTAIRNWCGVAADIVGGAPGAMGAYHLMGWYPMRAAQALERTSTTRPLAETLHLDGTCHRQTGVSRLDEDDVEYRIGLWASGADAIDAWQELQYLEKFLADLTTYGTDERFTLYHGSETLFLFLPGETLTVEPSREYEGWDLVWRVDLRARNVRVAA